jgi:hypothetical protein
LKPTTFASVSLYTTNPSSEISDIDSSSEPGGPPAYEAIAARPSLSK